MAALAMDQALDAIILVLLAAVLYLVWRRTRLWYRTPLHELARRRKKGRMLRSEYVAALAALNRKKAEARKRMQEARKEHATGRLADEPFAALASLQAREIRETDRKIRALKALGASAREWREQDD